MIEGFKYVSAYFTDEDKQTIRSYWQDPAVPEKLVETIIQADPENAEFKNLLEVVSMDELHANTWEYIKESEQAFKDQVIAIAKENGWIVNIDDGGSNDLYKMLIEMIFTFDESKDKEKLFHFKLQMFEQDFIKNSKDKELKKQLRRADNILEVIRHSISIFDATQAASSSDDSD